MKVAEARGLRDALDVEQMDAESLREFVSEAEALAHWVARSDTEFAGLIDGTKLFVTTFDALASGVRVTSMVTETVDDADAVRRTVNVAVSVALTETEDVAEFEADGDDDALVEAVVHVDTESEFDTVVVGVEIFDGE